MSTIAENIAAIRARIDAAARLSGRTGADITLVAADSAHDLPHLVGLQVADEVQRRAVIGVFLQLFRHLLHPVFAQRVDTGGDGLLTPGGVVHLAGAHQRDILAGV